MTFTVEMKKNIFRNTAVLVVASLLALALLQALWLGRMYSDMNEKFNRQVAAAFERAAYDELVSRSGIPRFHTNYRSSRESNDSAFVRIDSLRLSAILDSIPLTDSIGKIRPGRVRGTAVLSRNSSNIQTYDSTQIKITVSDESSLAQNIIVMEMLTGLGPTLDNMLKCDSLLYENLLQADIDVPYRLSLENIEDGEVIHQTGDEVSNPVVFELAADARGKTVYRLEIANPNKGFLREMSGVLISSVLIILLLGFSFSYLLRTMFRQKSLEIMRLDLTHNITHELKTPIAVASAAEEALTGFGAAEDPQKRKQYLRVISDQLANLSGMVENILSMSLYEQSEYPLEFGEHNLRRIVEGQARALSLTGGERVSLSIDIPEDLTLICDRTHFSTVIKNLLDNAAKYSPGRAEIEVRASERDGHINISVSDNGIGIPRGAQKRIFEKFYRVPTGNRHDVKGFGLGLYYVNDMVAKHGGKIAVESAPERGTTFTITVPKNGQ